MKKEGGEKSGGKEILVKVIDQADRRSMRRLLQRRKYADQRRRWRSMRGHCNFHPQFAACSTLSFDFKKYRRILVRRLLQAQKSCNLPSLLLDSTHSLEKLLSGFNIRSQVPS